MVREENDQILFFREKKKIPRVGIGRGGYNGIEVKGDVGEIHRI